MHNLPHAPGSQPPRISPYTHPMIRNVVRQVSRLLLPIPCTTCAQPLADDPVPFFCRPCWTLIRPLRGSACARCRRPLASPTALSHSPTHECHDCRTRKPYYAEVWAPYAYCSPLQDAIALFKYQGKVALADALATLLIQTLPPELEGDVLMPIPLHPNRLRQREFNQSLLLADRVATVMKCPVSYRNLIRLIDTEPQTTLPRSARLHNLRRAFALHAPQEVAGKRILLIDDVFTTGTTSNECAKILCKAGAERVTVLALARSVEAGLVPEAWLPASGPRSHPELRA